LRCIRSRNSVKKVKPHPDHLTYVMESLKISGKESVMVGDHLMMFRQVRGQG